MNIKIQCGITLSPRVEWRQDNFLAILTSAPIFNLNIPTGKLENWGPQGQMPGIRAMGARLRGNERGTL